MQQCQVALRHLYQFFTICDQVLSCLLEAQLSLDPLLNSVSNHMLEQQMSTHVGEIRCLICDCLALLGQQQQLQQHKLLLLARAVAEGLLLSGCC